MQFDSINAFFNMGGYGFYVWLAYGVCFGSLGILLLTSLRQKKKILAQITQKIAREQRLKQHRRNNESKT